MLEFFAMSQLTLELPESLQMELERRAALEGVSLHTYVVDSLSRFMSTSDLVSQKVSFEEMPIRYPQEQADAALRDLLTSRKAP